MPVQTGYSVDIFICLGSITAPVQRNGLNCFIWLHKKQHAPAVECVLE